MKIEKLFENRITPLTLVILLISMTCIVYETSERKPPAGSIHYLSVDPGNVCINGYSYTVTGNGRLDLDRVAQPSVKQNDGSEVLMPALVVRC